MRGLLEKDIRIILSRKKSLLLLMVFAIMLGFTTEGTFIVGYLTVLTTILAVSTISYDEMNNGFKYLMTLPIDARSYVYEKYLFCIGSIVIGWIVSVIIMFAVYMLKGIHYNAADNILEAACILPVLIIIETLMITAQLKYGMEKSRLIIAVIAGIIFVGTLVLKTMQNHADNTAGSVIAAVNALNPAGFLIGAFIICIIVLAAGISLSIKIMMHKID